MYNKIFSLLTSTEKKKFLFLLIFVFIAMILEMLSIGLIIPILSFFLQPEKLSLYLSTYNIKIDSNFLLYGSLVIISVFFVKNLFLSFFLWTQNYITNEIRVALSARLFKNYLEQNYSIFIKENFGDAVRNLRVEAMRYGSLLLQYINLINEIFIIIGLVILLYFNNALLSFIFFSMLVISSVIYLYLTNKKIKEMGKIRFESEGKAIKYILEGLNAFREIKLKRLEEKLIKSFKNENFTYSLATTKGSFFSELPKLWLEFLAVIIFLVFIIILDFKTSNRDEILITLGLLAGICFRTIPSIKKIIVSINKMKFSLPAVNELHRIIFSFNNSKSIKNYEKINFNTKIEFINVSFYYDNVDISLRDINFEIKKGEVVSIIGETGSGKTTLIDLISGLLKPKKGKIIVDDHVISNGDYVEWWKKISYLPQSPFIFNDTIFNNITLFEEKNKHNEDKLKKILKIADLEKFNLKKNDNVLISNGLDISGGEKQRIGIARALFNDSDVLILDESTSALDQKTEETIINNILNFDKTKTIIFITHKNYPLSKSKKVYEINNNTLKLKYEN